jgi:hypothetical protein
MRGRRVAAGSPLRALFDVAVGLADLCDLWLPPMLSAYRPGCHTSSLASALAFALLSSMVFTVQRARAAAWMKLINRIKLAAQAIDFIFYNQKNGLQKEPKKTIRSETQRNVSLQLEYWVYSSDIPFLRGNGVTVIVSPR